MTPEGIEQYIERFGFRPGQVKKEELIKNGYPYMNDLIRLYKEHPDWEGKIIQRVLTETNEIVDKWVRKI